MNGPENEGQGIPEGTIGSRYRASWTVLRFCDASNMFIRIGHSTFEPQCDASLVGMRDRRRMQFLGKRRTPGGLKWCSRKSLDSQEQTHTHKKYSQRIESVIDYAHKRALRCPRYSPRRNNECTPRGTHSGVSSSFSSRPRYLN